MNMLSLTYDDFLRESYMCKGSHYQDIYVIIDGKEYRVKDWYTDCNPIVDPLDYILRGECDHRIVFEINESIK